MSKIQAIIGLFIVLVVTLSMFQMFPRESFINGTGLGFIGKKLDYNTLATPLSQTNGNLGYPGKAYLGLALPPPNYKVNMNNDQALSYGFPSSY